MTDCRLYLISPDGIELESFSKQLEEALQGGDVASFQLRMKSASREELISAAKVLVPLCHKYDVAFILNDNPKLALDVGADGVHLGQSDESIAEARTLLGHNAIIGATCHGSKHLAFEAGEAGVDYVAFGAFYPTKTKTVEHTAELNVIKDWVEVVEIPCVAIGGITQSNCTGILEAGADFIAVSNSVWNHPKGPKVAVQEFNDIFKAG